MSDHTHFDYEQSDISSNAVALIAAGLATFIAAVPLIMPLVFPQSGQHRTPGAPPALTSDAPPLAISPRAELRLKRRGDNQFSETYGWTNRAEGVARIPIARAMDLLAQRGRPGWSSR